MKFLLSVLFFLGCQMATLAQSEPSLLVESDWNLLNGHVNEFYGFGNCYFSDKSFRQNGDLNKKFDLIAVDIN
jgi:hypothetical protein